MKIGFNTIKILKWFSIVLGVFFIFLAVVWLLLPRYAIDYIEEHDREWINRDITVEELSVNFFDFSVSLEGIRITEPDFTTTFMSSDQLFLNFESWPLLKSKIITEEITVDNLYAAIIQNTNTFNFSDLLDGKTEKKDQDTEPVFFLLKNIHIKNSRLQYTDQAVDNTISLDSISIQDKSFSSEDAVWDGKIQIHQPEGGWLLGDVSFNIQNSDYTLKTDITHWELSPFTNYLTSVIRLNKFAGQLHSNLEISGNTGQSDYLRGHGDIKVTDIEVLDPENEPLVRAGEILLDIKEVDTKSSVYDFKKILVDNSFVRFEYLPNGNNFTKWLVNNTTEIESSKNTSDYYVSPFEILSVYIYDLTKDYIFKSYAADVVEVRDFNLKFQDYTLEDPFFMDITALDVLSQDIRPESKFADFDIKGIINSTAQLKGAIKVSRDGVEDMDVDMGIQGLFLNRFSPYGRFYTAHPLMEGIVSYTNKSVIKDSYLHSTNDIFVEQIKVGKKRKTNSGYSLPLRLVVGLVKDIDGNVNLEIPIEGPINDPEYKFGKVIWQTIKNIFIKLAASPFKALSNALNLNEDDLKTVYFDSGQIGLSPLQKKPLNSIAKVLQNKLDFTIQFDHLYNKEYEMDALALKSAKLLYLKQSDIPINDEVPIGKQAFDIPNTDAGFLEYVKNETPNFDETISIPENVRKLLGEEAVTIELEKVIFKQKELIKDYLIEEKGIDENRFVINDMSASNKSINQTSPKFEIQLKNEENTNTLAID